MLPYIHFCMEKKNNNYDAIYISPKKHIKKNGEKVVLACRCNYCINAASYPQYTDS